MGLDVYGHHTRIPFEGERTNSDDFNAFTEKVDALAQANLKEAIEEGLKPLREEYKHWKGLEGEQPNDYREHAYNMEYFSFVAKLRGLIGRNYDFKMYPYTDKILELPELEKLLNKEVEMAYEEYDIYFRKVNFLFAYFEDRGLMVDQYYAFVTPEDVKDIIHRCEQILEAKNEGDNLDEGETVEDLAQELLPTQSGFFFGSTDYDEWYFHDVNDCLTQMRKWLPMLEEEGVTGYMIFSW